MLQKQQGTVSFTEDMILDNFSMDDNVTLTAGKWVEVMNYKVPSQEIRYFGKSQIISGVDDRGFFKLDLQTSGDDTIQGNARLVARDSNGWNPKPIISPRSEILASTGERLGFTGVGAKTDSYLAIEFKADTTLTAVKAKSTVSLSTTVSQGASIIR